MSKPKPKLTEYFKYSEITRITGINEKMLQRYDNGGSVSKANRAELDALMVKFKDINFLNKCREILSKPPSITTVNDATPSLPTQFPFERLKDLSEIVGEMSRHIVNLNETFNEIISMNQMLAESIILLQGQKQQSSSEDLKFQITSQASTIARIDEELKKLRADIVNLRALNTNAPLPKLEDIKIQSTTFDVSPSNDDDDEEVELL